MVTKKILTVFVHYMQFMSAMLAMSQKIVNKSKESTIVKADLSAVPMVQENVENDINEPSYDALRHKNGKPRAARKW